MDSPSPQDSARKKRKQAPRVKTGCLTCKYRRVKCGEEKPICHRCIKFDVQCDGYPAEILSRSAKDRRLLPIPKQGPSPKLFENEDERQYFDLFCSHTGYEILPGFESASIRQALLQSCHSDPCIRHAIVAIGALDKTAEVTRDFGSLSIDVENVNGSEHHTAALQQYSKAVQCMNQATLGSQMDLKTTLLTCLLIVCFEAWNGNLQLAVQQVHIAIGILQEWESKYNSGGEERTTLSPAPDIISHELIQIFCRLAIQLSFIADQSSSSTRAILGSEGSTFVSSMPDVFASLQEASMYQQALQRRGGYFIATFGTAWGSGNPAPTEEVSQEKNEIEQLARCWLSALEPLVKQVDDINERRHAHTILLQMTSGLISITTSLTADEMVYDTYNDIFSQVVDLSEAVLDALPKTAWSCNTHFCFDARIILPLWKTGLKCRDPITRRKAISLLLSRPMKEGIWDSILAGKMVNWVMELEEEFADENGVPGWARIAGVKWTSDMEARTALLTCRQRIEGFSDEILVKRKIISW